MKNKENQRKPRKKQINRREQKKTKRKTKGTKPANASGRRNDREMGRHVAVAPRGSFRRGSIHLATSEIQLPRNHAPTPLSSWAGPCRGIFVDSHRTQGEKEARVIRSLKKKTRVIHSFHLLSFSSFVPLSPSFLRSDLMISSAGSSGLPCPPWCLVVSASSSLNLYFAWGGMSAI